MFCIKTVAVADFQYMVREAFSRTINDQRMINTRNT